MIELKSMKYQMLMHERKELHKKNSKKDVIQDLLHSKSGDYAICKYDDKVWVAFISSYNEKFDDFKVKLLYSSGYNCYRVGCGKKSFWFSMAELNWPSFVLTRLVFSV